MSLNTIRWERWMLVATLTAAMLPLATSVGLFGLALYSLPLFTLVALWLARTSVSRTPWTVSVWDAALGALGLWMALSTLAGSPTAPQVRNLVRWETALLLAWYAKHNYRVTYGFVTVRRFAVWALVLQVAVGVLQLVTGSPVGSAQSYFGEAGVVEVGAHEVGLSGVVGTLGQRNMYGVWMTVLLPFAYVGALRRRGGGGRGQYGSAALWVAGLAMVVCSLSRFNTIASLLTPALFVAVWGAAGREGLFLSQTRLLAVGAVCLGVSGVVVAVASAGVLDQVELYAGLMSARFGDTGSAFSFRGDMNREAILNILRSPVLGIGFENSALIWNQVGSALPSGWTYRPHNVFLIIGVEGGLVSLLLLAYLTARPFSTYWFNREAVPVYVDVLAVSVTLCLAASMVYVVPIGHAVWPLFMFLLGTFAAASRTVTVGLRALARPALR